MGTAGDVNGDGYDDVVVGACLNDNSSGVNAGAAYVLYGGASPNAVVDLTLHGTVGADDFGYSVGTAGDVNGDGYDDLVVGAYYSYAGGAYSGQAYVYFGGASPDTVADVTHDRRGRVRLPRLLGGDGRGRERRRLRRRDRGRLRQRRGRLERGPGVRLLRRRGHGRCGGPDADGAGGDPGSSAAARARPGT